MSDEYIYDAEEDTYIGNMSSCLQLKRITKYSPSVYRMTTGEILLGDNNDTAAKYKANISAANCHACLREFVVKTASVRCCNEMIPHICNLLSSLVSSNEWYDQSNKLNSSEQSDINKMIDYIREHYEGSTWKDNIMLLDILCRKTGICLYIPQMLPLEWSEDITNNMVYIVCKNPIMVASRLINYICIDDSADGLLPKLKLTHDRKNPASVTNKEGMLIKNASLYSVMDSRFEGYIMRTELDTTYIDSHIVLESAANSRYAFAYHLKGLVLLDSIDTDDRNLAIYSIRKLEQFNDNVKLRDSVKIDLLSEEIHIPEKDVYGNFYSVADITHKVLIDNNESDSDLKWLRRFHKYYTILTCISSITNMLSIFKIFTRRAGDRKDDVDGHEKVNP